MKNRSKRPTSKPIHKPISKPAADEEPAPEWPHKLDPSTFRNLRHVKVNPQSIDGLADIFDAPPGNHAESSTDADA